MAVKLEPPRLPGSLPGGHRLAWLTRPVQRKVLLGCGVVAPVWWVAIDVVGSLRQPGYRYRDFSISELSAQGASTRLFMAVVSGIPYGVLLIAFGAGVWIAAGEQRAGRVAAGLLIAGAAWGTLGGLRFPMAPRGTAPTLRNTRHLPYAAGMSIFFLLAIAFGARTLGTRFRYFSYGTIVALLVFGALTSMQAGRIPTNGATPWMGVEERVNAYASMLWIAVLAVSLLRAEATRVPRRLTQPAAASPQVRCTSQ